MTSPSRNDGFVALARQVQAAPRAYGERHVRELCRAVLSLADQLNWALKTDGGQLPPTHDKDYLGGPVYTGTPRHEQEEEAAVSETQRPVPAPVPDGPTMLLPLNPSVDKNSNQWRHVFKVPLTIIEYRAASLLIEDADGKRVPLQNIIASINFGATPEPTAVDSAIPRSKVEGDVLGERRRQVEQEGWDAEHDDEHWNGGLALAAACYASLAAAQAQNGASPEAYTTMPPPFRWPWEQRWWKPKNPRRDLVRAAALILAEIERLDRRADSGTAEKP